MSQPEHEAIINEIRSARVAASPELRARVRAIAAAARAAVRRRGASCRGAGSTLVLVPACVAARAGGGARGRAARPPAKARAGCRASGAVAREAAPATGVFRALRLRGRRHRRRRRRPAATAGSGAAVRGGADAEGRATCRRSTKRALRLTRDFRRLRAQRRVRPGRRAGLRVRSSSASRSAASRRRSSSYSALGHDPRPARLDPGRPAAARQAVPAAAGAARR